MKKSIYLVIVLTIFSSYVLADNNQVKISIQEFTGGSYNFNLNFYSDSFYGARGDGLREGGTVSTLDFHQSFTSYNPAGLAFQKGPVASMSLIPFPIFNSDTSKLFVGNQIDDSITKGINDQLNSSFKNNNNNGVTNDTGGDLAVQGVAVEIGQPIAITGLEGMVPFAQNNACVAVAREQKFSMELNLMANGVGALLNLTSPDDSSINLTARALADVQATANINCVVTSIGIGRKLTPQWGIGAVLEHYDADISGNANANIDASGTMQGNTFEYNTNPGNSLSQSASGDLTASGWGLRLGTSLHAPNDQAEVGLDFSIEPELTFTGPITAVGHEPPTDSSILFQEFLSGNLTTTEKTPDTSGVGVSMKLPSFMRATAAWKPGPVLAFNYTHYFDSLSFKLDTNSSYSNAFMDMTDAFRLGFNFEYFQIGGGIILANEGSTEIDKIKGTVSTSSSSIPIPVFSLGWIIPLGSSVLTEWELLAVPMPFLKAAITYMY